jgi:hypothetical protein
VVTLIVIENGPPPDKMQIISIKILDRFLSTTAVRILQGLQLAADKNARVVNLSVGGVKLSRSAAVDPCKKFAKIARRNPGMLIVIAAGNEGLNLDTIDFSIFPQTCERDIQSHVTAEDIWADAIYVGNTGDFQEARALLSKAASIMRDYGQLDMTNKISASVRCLDIMEEFQQEKDPIKRKSRRAAIESSCEVFDLEKIWSYIK